MPRRLRDLLFALAGAAAIAVAFWAGAPTSGQASAARIPRTSDGKPDLNGIWQALNTANYDLQAHPARPAMSLLPAPGRSGTPGLVRAPTVELPAPAVRPLGAVGERCGHLE